MRNKRHISFLYLTVQIVKATLEKFAAFLKEFIVIILRKNFLRAPGVKHAAYLNKGLLTKDDVQCDPSDSQ